MKRPLNIACLQTRPMPEFESALQEVLPLAKEAVKGGAEVLFLPEYCGGLKSKDARLVPPVAHQSSHPYLIEMRRFARQNRVWINIGSIAIGGDDHKFLNRGFLVDPDGDIVGSYDKVHLFDVRLSTNEFYIESDSVKPGCQAVLYETPIAKIGHTICYDLRFPHLYRELSQIGAEILGVPAAFTKTTGRDHWHVLNRARAIENGAFVVSACAVGEIPGGGECYGHSLIIDPWGRVVADGGPHPGVVSAEIDLELVAEARQKIPSLQHDQDVKKPTMIKVKNESHAA